MRVLARYYLVGLSGSCTYVCNTSLKSWLYVICQRSDKHRVQSRSTGPPVQEPIAAVHTSLLGSMSIVCLCGTLFSMLSPSDLIELL
jgi:hypothetical protein